MRRFELPKSPSSFPPFPWNIRPRLLSTGIIDAIAWRGCRRSGMISVSLFAQGLLRIAGDPLVAFRQCGQLVTANDIVDRLEGPVVGTLEHLAQDRVGRVGAIGQNDAG